MNIIKLNATASTNDFLKQLNSTQNLENFTTVVTQHQTNGKGQRGSYWNSTPYKNLTFSTLIKKKLTQDFTIFDLNIAVSVAIVQALEMFKIPTLNIKWPNDILSEDKKIAGILIENTLMGSYAISSIIGVGLNVNQTNFEHLPQASSLKKITQKEFNLEVLLLELIKQIQQNYQLITQQQTSLLWEKYHNYLYKKDSISVFKNQLGEKFTGIIQQVLPNGKIQILLENQIIKEFDLKEVKMIY